MEKAWALDAWPFQPTRARAVVAPACLGARQLRFCGHSLLRPPFAGSVGLEVPRGRAELADRGGGRDLERGRLVRKLLQLVNRAETPEARASAEAAHRAALF